MPSDMEKLVADHVKPGYAAKWLSRDSIDQRGLRGWEPIIRAGDLVTYRGMILAQMPPEKKTAREEFFTDLNAQQLGIPNYSEPKPPRCWFCRLKAWIGRKF